MYYDNTRHSSRFDFYTSYIGLHGEVPCRAMLDIRVSYCCGHSPASLSIDEQWHYNFTILFVPNQLNNRTFPMIYHIFPDQTGNNCSIRSSFIPNISPNWLQVTFVALVHD